MAGDLVEDEHGVAASTCRECVLLDVVHVVGLPGAGARAEHERRVGKHEKQIRTRHPRLGGLILALSDDPRSTRAWAVGASGEEALGSRLSSVAGPGAKVLHDRKRQGSTANIDHLVVTSRAVWVLDAKKHSGRIEARGHGLFSRRPPDLYVDGRDRSKDVAAVAAQVAHVESVLDRSAAHDVTRPPVRGALVYVDGEFGLFASPFEVGGVLVTWGKDVCGRFAAEVAGPYDPAAIAKHLAAALRPGHVPPSP